MSELSKRDSKGKILSNTNRHGYGRITENDKWLPYGVMTGSAAVVGGLTAFLVSFFAMGLASVIAAVAGLFFLATLVFGAQGAHKLFIGRSRD